MADRALTSAEALRIVDDGVRRRADMQEAPLTLGFGATRVAVTALMYDPAQGLRIEGHSVPERSADDALTIADAARSVAALAPLVGEDERKALLLLPSTERADSRLWLPADRCAVVLDDEVAA